MDINYELYKVFYHVAVTLSFSEASKQLFISQSAVSQSIKVLEKKLNQPLFIRSTKRVQLTPEGEILLKHIEPAMNLIQTGGKPAFRGPYLKRRPAAHRRQRHHLPLLSGTLLKTVPQRISQHSYQSDQPDFHCLCQSSWKMVRLDFIIANYPNSGLSQAT